VLCYEYNMFEIERTKLKAKGKLPVGKVKIEVESKLAKPGAPMDVTMKVNGAVVAEGKVPITVPGWFTGNDCLDLGSDLGSPCPTITSTRPLSLSTAPSARRRSRI